MLRKSICALVLLGCALSAVPLPIYFEGNRNIDARTLYDALGLRLPYAYEFWKEHPAAEPEAAMLLGETLTNFYKSKGYYHAAVRTALSDDAIRFILSEKAPIRVADVTLLSSLDIAAFVPFSAGMPFDTEKFAKSKSDIRAFYADNSYCNAQLDAKAWVDIENDAAYLLYDVEPGMSCRFGTVTIRPAEHVDVNIIASLLDYKEGDVFAPERLRRSYDTLYAQEGIAKAVIDSSAKTVDTVLTDISVTEYPKPLRLKSGVGYSSDEGVMLLLGLTHRNFFGNLKRLGAEARYTTLKQTAKASFDMPLAHHNVGGAEAGYENEVYEGFKEQRIYETLFIAQQRLPHKLKESLLFDQTITYDSDDIALFPPEHFYIVSPKLQWSYDVRDKILDPSKGFMLGAEAQGSLKSSVSDASYYRFLASGATIIPLKPSILALRARYGSLRIYEGGVPPSYRFYAGGMNSNRAYGYRKLGPVNSDGDPTGFDSVLTGTAEYRFPVSGNFKAVLFNDTTFIGNSFIPDYDKGYFAVGVGIRYMTPVGPLAIDVGMDVEERDQVAVHFHVGELF